MSLHSNGEPRAEARRGPDAGFARAASWVDEGASASLGARIAMSAAASELTKAKPPAPGRTLSVRLQDVMGFMDRTSASRPSLLAEQRAVGLADAMSRGAMIFDSAVQATPALFARSRPVPMYNFFVSHSWSASRWDKFAGLLYR
jgi:hypothetical protein